MFSFRIDVCSEDNDAHSILVVDARCEILDGFASVLGHQARTEIIVNSNLVESLSCAYRRCTIGGGHFSVHSFAIALYFWR